MYSLCSFVELLSVDETPLVEVSLLSMLDSAVFDVCRVLAGSDEFCDEFSCLPVSISSFTTSGSEYWAASPSEASSSLLERPMLLPKPDLVRLDLVSIGNQVSFFSSFIRSFVRLTKMACPLRINQLL